MLIKIPETSDHKCDSCGLILNAGDLFYHCRTEIITDKEGQTPVDLNFPDKLIAQALFELESRGEQEILDDIYQEIILLLCPKCCAILRQRLHSLTSKWNDCPKRQPDPQMENKGKLLHFHTKKNPLAG